jgi:hypothetical protein
MHASHTLHPATRSRFWIGAFLLLMGATAHAAPLRYTIQQLGLAGEPYTETYVSQLSEQGQVTGYSRFFVYTPPVYPGDSPKQELHQDAWLYSGGSTVQLGYTGAGYERSDGYRYSQLSGSNDLSQIAGISYRYGATNSYYLGADAWLYSGGSTVQLGFTGAGYEHNFGYRVSSIWALNNQGQVVGRSERYIAGSGLSTHGSDAWFYSGGSTVQIGFTGAGYETAGDGFRASEASSILNEQGEVAGFSARYSGLTYRGRDAWLYSGGSTVQIGLIGAGYERSDGYRSSYAPTLNQQGQVIGSSERYSGTTALGADAWLYSGGSTVQLGFTGAGYERSNGYRRNVANYLNEQGQVAGFSERYSGTTNLGLDAWLYSGGTTVQLGFTGAGYERSDGLRSSLALGLNELGQVAGYSERYSGTTALGRDMWLYNGSSTVQLGLTGAGYERSDGFRRSTLSDLNEQGQVAGYSERYSGTKQLGQDAWLYDAGLDQTFNLSMFVDKNGYAFSNVSYLGDDGVVLGSYQFFDQDTGYSGSRAFYFTVDEGFYDLDLLVDDLTEDGWLSLATAISANGVGNIIGYGDLSGVSGAAYLLTPVSAEVPIPAAVWLFASGLGLLGWMQRRQSA